VLKVSALVCLEHADRQQHALKLTMPLAYVRIARRAKLPALASRVGIIA
jgi:hypothetical protein